VSASPNFTTMITELSTTSAGHVGATFSSLHPDFTLYAFFEFLAFNKIDEDRIVFLNLRVNLIFLTSLSDMKNCSAVETVVLLTHNTVEFKIISLVFLIEDKNEFAIRGGAPRYIFLQFKCIFILEFGKFSVSLCVKNILDVEIT
jgi:hypothetical protein